MANGKRSKNLKRVKFKMNLSWKNMIIYVFLFLFIAFIFLGLNQSANPSLTETKTVPLSQAISDVRGGKVTSMDVYPNKLVLHEKGGDIQSTKESTSDVYQLFKNAGVSLDKTKVNVNDDTSFNNWINIISTVGPVLLMIAFFYFIFRQARGAQESVFSFGQ